MKEFDFTLTFSLSNSNSDPQQYVDRLYKSGCDDALVGVGTKGVLGMRFTRKSETLVFALLSAINDVLNAIPNAILVKATCTLTHVPNSTLYTLVIDKDTDSDYGVTVSNLPGCFSCCKTIREVIENTYEAIECHLEDNLSSCLLENVILLRNQSG
jgi:predicted RNase H-like HicB family nuclease